MVKKAKLWDLNRPLMGRDTVELMLPNIVVKKGGKPKKFRKFLTGRKKLHLEDL